MILTWKFNNLDLNDNSILEKGEYKDLKRIVKKVMKPKKCAKQFPRICDVDRDSVITLQEWDECLHRDGLGGKYHSDIFVEQVLYKIINILELKVYGIHLT